MKNYYNKQDSEEEQKRIEKIDGPTNFADVSIKSTENITDQQTPAKGSISPTNEQVSSSFQEETPSLRVSVKTAPWDEGEFDSSFVDNNEDINDRKRRKSDFLNSNKEVIFNV